MLSPLCIFVLYWANNTGIYMSLIIVDGDFAGLETGDQFLDNTGNGTGTTNLIGDYSVTSQKFFIKPPANETYLITRLDIFIYDNGVGDLAEYGNTNLPLTNGVVLRLWDDIDNAIIKNLTKSSIKSNADYLKFGFMYAPWQGGGGDTGLSLRMDFIEKFGQPLRVRGVLGHRFEVVLNDNLSTLLSHTFHVDYLIENKRYDR